MWFSAIANYKGGLAKYNIIQENENVYHAILVKYDGKEDKTPPSNVVLIRSVRHWSGSIEDQNLLDELGVVIDRRVNGRLYHQLRQNALREKRR